MYNLPHHKEHDEKVIREFVARYPFAFISGVDRDHKPIATQIPVFIEEKNGKKVLRGHLMRNTDHHRAFEQNDNVLVVFTGHHTYVSATWYTNKNWPSTWNYMSVHVNGKIRFVQDEELIDVLRMTSLYFEKNDRNSPTIYDNLSPELTARLIKAIVAFEIEIIELDTVFKLSQDRDIESYRNIIEELKQQGESGKVIADEMEKRTKQVFPGKN